MFSLILILNHLQVLSQGCTVYDIQKSNLEEFNIEKINERKDLSNPTSFTISSSFFYGLIYSGKNGGAVSLVLNNSNEFQLEKSLFIRCGVENGVGGAIYFQGFKAKFDQIVGVDCQATGDGGQFIYAFVPSWDSSIGGILKMSQSTIFRCSGEVEKRLFLNQIPDSSCFFQTIRDKTNVSDDFLRIDFLQRIFLIIENLVQFVD